MKIFNLALFMMLAGASAVFAETAILPYRIINSSNSFTESTGSEYARIMYVTALTKKKVAIASPESIEMDIENLHLGPTITDEEVRLLGKTRQFDYVLAGSLTKIRDSFLSRTRIYSVQDRRIIFEFENRAADLFRLAVLDVQDAFATSENARRSNTDKLVDIAVLMDLSYPVKNELNALREGLHDFFRSLCDSSGYDSRICLIPFSDKISVGNISVTNNAMTFKKILDELKPAGKSGNRELSAAFRHALKNLRWRSNSERIIIAVLNSDITHSIELENHAYSADKMRIPVYAVLCERVSPNGSKAIKRITEMTGGSNFHVTYHRTFINSGGERGELFLERGRLFYSPMYTSSWKQGILQEDPMNPAFLRFDEKYEEISEKTEPATIKTDTMVPLYQRVASDIVVKSENLENNISPVFDSVLNRFTASSLSTKHSLARVLLSDGKVSFWAGISDKKILNYLTKKEQQKYFFTLGVLLSENNNDSYGLSIAPALTEISSVDIPAAAKTNMTEIIMNKKKYLSPGIASLPLWFVSVKVEDIVLTKEIEDIREP
ncbi:MAG TPA: vWA domain-containing protein [Spirochaetota bacterium]|nr:vWA domain-containing protein [Spirochaetota bacterium]HPI89632.1 vWA domain-containing protein [Spirochaetota bacterium]HPR49211.1 vWA domain-containing protein [Spirochaetota bacterium]